MPKKNNSIDRRIAELVQNFLDEGVEADILAKIFATHAVQINLIYFDVNLSNGISIKNLKDLFINIIEGLLAPILINNVDTFDNKCANDNQKLIKSAIVKSKKFH